MSQSKIVIELTDAHNPPKVFVDGEEVKVISLGYHYETRTDIDPGKHKFNLVIPSVVDGKFQTKCVAFYKN